MRTPCSRAVTAGRNAPPKVKQRKRLPLPRSHSWKTRPTSKQPCRIPRLRSLKTKPSQAKHLQTRPIPATRAAVPVKRESTWPPVFGAMLAEALTPAAQHSGALARIWPPASKPERQVSMSLRVAASEQALIKARAAEAGISASAYLRQCALEVEQLRAQVQHTLAVIERKSTLALPAGEAPAHVSRRGFLGRMRRRIFGGRDTALTLRA